MADEFREAGWLVAEWPHPLFRRRLFELLDDDSAPIVARAARALVNYRDPESLEAVRRFKDDERTIVAGCFGYALSERVAEALASATLSPRFETTEGDGLPMAAPAAEFSYLCPFPIITGDRPEGMTVELAVRGLAHPKMCVRLRAFSWLANRGIVLATEPLESAWAIADESQRAGLFYALHSAGERLGRSRLRSALEKLVVPIGARDYSERTRSALALGLGRAGSPRARDFALPIIRAAAGTEFHAPEITERPTESQITLGRALDAMVLVAGARDLDEARHWTRSPHEAVAATGYCVLARLDTDEAFRGVNARLADDKLFEFFSLNAPDLLYVIRSREWADPSLKWKYVWALNRRMQRVADRVNPQGPWQSELPELDELIHTLEALTRTVHGLDSFAGPGWDAPRAVETARRWNDWLQAIAPPS
jgi:HEAT repeat protein